MRPHHLPAVAPLVVAGAAVLAACAATGSGPSAEETRYLEEVARIDRSLTEDPATALRTAGRICADIAAGRATDDVVTNARRATGGEGLLDRDRAAALVESARPLCGTG